MNAGPEFWHRSSGEIVDVFLDPEEDSSLSWWYRGQFWSRELTFNHFRRLNFEIPQLADVKMRGWKGWMRGQKGWMWGQKGWLTPKFRWHKGCFSRSSGRLVTFLEMLGSFLTPRTNCLPFSKTQLRNCRCWPVSWELAGQPGVRIFKNS